MDMPVVVGLISGISGIVVGVIGATFTAGQKYAGLGEISRKQDKIEQDFKDCQLHTSEQFKKCQDEEIQRMKDLSTLLNTHNNTMGTLTSGLAALTATLVSVPKQSDLTQIVDRLSHIEGILNGKQLKTP